MLFSISIPVYNSEKYLDECIQSIMCQSEKDFELILVDDGSRDNSLEICKKWQSQFPSVIRVIEKENEGSLLTRRRCLNESRGDYLYIVDADDYLLGKDVLEKIRFEINMTKADLIFFGYKDINSTDGFYGYDFPAGKILEGKELLLLYRLIFEGSSFNSLWNKVFSRELVDWDTDYSKFDQVRVGTDIFQTIPILSNAKSAVYIDEPLYYYRTTEGSIVHSFNSLIFESQKARMRQLERYASEWGFDNLEVMLAKQLIENACSAVYSMKKMENKEWKIQNEFVKKVSNDIELRKAFKIIGIKSIENKKKIIALLLLFRFNKLLVLLVDLIPNMGTK